MSQTQRQREASEATAPGESPYPRRNWWGEDDETTDHRGGHDELAGTSREAYVAHKLLKEWGATMLDPVSLFEEPGEDAPEAWCLHDDGEIVALSEPSEYVPKRHDGAYGSFDYRQFRHRNRVSEEYGYLSFGGPIADRPTEEFLAVVDAALDDIEAVHIPPATQREIRKRAKRMKQCSDLHDTQIMKRVVRWMAYPGDLDI